jgi:hypothetical protein
MDLRRRSPRRTPGLQGRTGKALVAGALLVILLGACSSGGGGSASDSSDSAGVAAPEAVSKAGADSGSAVRGKNAIDTTDLQPRSVIKTGRVSLESKDLGTVRDEIDRLLARYGGYVDQESTNHDSKGRVSSSELQLRVPSQDFDTVLTAFGDFATVTDVEQSAEDVTTEVIDVDARVRTAEVSLERLRKFLGRSANVDAVIRLESEIAQREADLASLRAQQRYLAGQTSLATISVQMSRTDTPSKDDPLSDAGFLTGLRNGWNALVDVAVVGATVAGALLPFALVATLVLVPLTLWLRARRRPPARPVAAGPPPAP